MSSEIESILANESALQEVVDHCFSDADADGNGTIDNAEFEAHIKMVYEDIGKLEVDQDSLLLGLVEVMAE